MTTGAVTAEGGELAALPLPPAPVRITAPGVYDIPERDYHLDPVPGGSLSSSGARRLLPPSCPALFRHWLDTGQAETSTAMDVGTAAHLLVLGSGPEIVVVDAKDWRKKDAQDARDEAHARGAVPLLTHQWERVQAMAAVLREHPLASRLLDPAHGRTEQTLVWWDADARVWRRARLDYLPHPHPRRRLIVPDYKTADSAEPDAIARALQTYGYHQQVDWYLDGVTSLGLPSDGPPAMVLIVQETRAPYLITVVEPDREAMEIARTRNRKALDIYRRCMESGHWPGYAEDVLPVGLPTWAVYQHADAVNAGDFDIEETP